MAVFFGELNKKIYILCKGYRILVLTIWFLGRGGDTIKRLHIGALICALAFAICIIPGSMGTVDQSQGALIVQDKSILSANQNSGNVLVNAAYKKTKKVKTYKKSYKKVKTYKKWKSYKSYKKVKAYKKSYKKTKTYKKTYKKVKAASTYRYSYGKGVGDCWANSDYLMGQLTKAGVKARIIQYRTSMSPRHRSVQLYQNGNWVDYNYKANGYRMRYWATSSKPGMYELRKNF